MLRRVVGRDGRSRAFVNDQPVGVALLRRAGALLVEVQGQHEQMGLADPASHAGLLDAFGVPAPLRQAVGAAWRDWREAPAALDRGARRRSPRPNATRTGCATRSMNSPTLAPAEGEEDRLAAERQRLQQGERRAEAIAAALAELTPARPPQRRPGGGAARRVPRAAAADRRRASRMLPNPAAPALAALERAEEALAEAETLLTRLAAEADVDPRLLEQAEERLFALRAAARKHAGRGRRTARPAGSRWRRGWRRWRPAPPSWSALEQAAGTAATRLRRGRRGACRRRVARRRRGWIARWRKELPPLRLDKARFQAEVAALTEAEWGAGGADAVRFLIATNPGQELGPLARIASGGELSRLMLALKVVLSAGSPVPTLVFDEVDSGVGGATAAAVGRAAGPGRRAAAGAGGDAQPAGGGARGGASAGGEGRRRAGARRRVVDLLDADGAARGDRPHAGRRNDHRGRARRGRRAAGQPA